jgi:hypothetical protein
MMTNVTDAELESLEEALPAARGVQSDGPVRCCFSE